MAGSLSGLTEQATKVQTIKQKASQNAADNWKV